MTLHLLTDKIVLFEILFCRVNTEIPVSLVILTTTAVYAKMITGKYIFKTCIGSLTIVFRTSLIFIQHAINAHTFRNL